LRTGGDSEKQRQDGRCDGSQSAHEISFAVVPNAPQSRHVPTKIDGLMRRGFETFDAPVKVRELDDCLSLSEAAFHSLLEIVDPAIHFLIDYGDRLGERVDSALEALADNVKMAAQFVDSAVEAFASGVNVAARFSMRPSVLLPRRLEQPLQFFVGHPFQILPRARP